MFSLLLQFAVATAVTSPANQNITATVNSSVSLTCAIQTTDPVRWKVDRFGEHSRHILVTLFNGKKVNPKYPRVTVKADGVTERSVLTIHDLQYDDAGKYSCDVSAKTGHITNKFTLTVVG